MPASEKIFHTARGGTIREFTIEKRYLHKNGAPVHVHVAAPITAGRVWHEYWESMSVAPVRDGAGTITPRNRSGPA